MKKIINPIVLYCGTSFSKPYNECISRIVMVAVIIQKEKPNVFKMEQNIVYPGSK